MSEHLLQAHRLVKRFGGRLALDAINLRLDAGDVLVLLGPNGAGKTTLLRCLLGLTIADSGEISYRGTPAGQLSAAARAGVGYVPQEFQGFDWMRTEALIRYLAGFYAPGTLDRARDLMRRLEVPEKPHVKTLSVGQRQRMSLVLGLMHDPDLLIMDEPVSALDPGGRREVISMLLGDYLTPKKTLIFSTHITSDAERIADRVAFLHEGRIVLDENLDELKERMRRVHLSGGADDLETVCRAADATGLNCLRAQPAGQGVVLTTMWANETRLAELAKQLNMDVTSDFLNLEDLYLEINK